MDKKNKTKKILGGAIGNCVHVAGVLNFLQLAREEGYETISLGPAVPIKYFIETIKKEKPDIIAIGYRLSTNACRKILLDFKEKLSKENLLNKNFVFGGTVSTARIAQKTGMFKKIFDGTQSLNEIISFLKNTTYKKEKKQYSNNLVERIRNKYPYPLIRHHIGLSTVKKTIQAVKEIAKAGVLDVVSIAPDQTAQESFFRPSAQKNKTKGAGGVPIRTENDLIEIYQATRRGNYPLVRCYSGTNDVFKWAEMLIKTIKNAWTAIPLFWYNQMDRRGPRSLFQTIQEAQSLIKWHANKGIPVEINDSHQWSLRYAPDAMAVADAYLAAYNAKKLGVKYYISQYMLNTPPQVSLIGDLAKMLAKIEMIETLHDKSFQSFREVRPGLLSFPPDLDAAKGQLAFSTMIGMALEPHIFHVVAYCEGQYAAGAKEIIESAKISNYIIKKYKQEFPIKTLLSDPAIEKKKEQLKKDAQAILTTIKKIGGGYEDPLTEPAVLIKAVKIGILDAPNLINSQVANGKILTIPVKGNYVSINPCTRQPISEKKRMKNIKL